MKNWHPDKMIEKRGFLEQRAEVIRAVRHFFEKRNYLEVDTPALQISPGMEPHLKAFKTELISADQQENHEMYLHTSPEFAMKKLLVAGLPKIFQICKVFRNAEGSSCHSPEFTMIEWYQAGMSYTELMDETIDLIRSVQQAPFEWKGLVSNPHQEWQKISVVEAFKEYADIELESVLDDFNGFEAQAKGIGISSHDEDSWDDLFFRVFLEKIEPNLGHPVPTILYDYPVSMAALSRPKKEDPRFSERFEVYICGLELANAFGELTDASLQKARFEDDMALKQELYGERYPIDQDFLDALEFGMPEASGIALGIDRLVMLCTGCKDINHVLTLPVSLGS